MLFQDSSTRHRNNQYIAPDISCLGSLVPKRSFLRKAQRRLPLSIRQHSINRRIVNSHPAHPIRNRHHNLSTHLHRDRGRCHLQIVYARWCGVRARERCSDQCIENLISILDLLLTATQIYTFSELTDLIVHQCTPEVAIAIVEVIRVGTDSIDGEVVEFAIEATVVGESLDLRCSIEGIERGVAWSWVVIGEGSVAGDRDA